MQNAREQLAKLVYDYSKAKKFANAAFINKVIEILVSYYDAIGYLDNAYIANLKDGEMLCGYDFFNRALYIDNDKLLSFTLDVLNEEKVLGLVNPSDIYLRVNLSYINSIAHEIIHARQFKRSCDKGQDLEQELLRLSFSNRFMLLQSDIDHRRLSPREEEFVSAINMLEKDRLYYGALPSERMAHIGSMKLALDVSESCDIEGLQDYSRLKYENGKLMGFLDGDCPSAYVLTCQNRLRNSLGLSLNAEESYDANRMYYLIKASNLGLGTEEKIHYGLPLRRFEVEKQAEKVNDMIRKLVDKK